jgi:hypothetical protein
LGLASRQHLQSAEKLLFTGLSVKVFVNKLESLNGLLLCDIHGTAHSLENFIEEGCKFVHIKGSCSISVVSGKDLVNILP